MFWLRMLLFTLPIGMAFAAMWLFQKVRHLEYRRSNPELVTLIREPIGNLNPLVPLTGMTREVTDLLFEPLLIRDDDLRIRPHLLSDWDSRTQITIRCASEEAAKQAENTLNQYRANEATPTIQIQSVARQNSILLVEVEGFDESVSKKLLQLVPVELQGKYLLVQLHLNNSVKESFETFLRGSVEKSQIRMLDYTGDAVANIFLDPTEPELFLKELRLYYESNRVLDPSIELVGNSCHTSYREMILRFRNDVRWHDGVLFSVDDVIYSYEELTKPGSMLPLKESFWYVDRLEKIDQRSLRIFCQASPAAILESWEKLPVVPSHLLKDTLNQNEWSDFFDKPIGNGPYRLEKRLPDGGISLISNYSYFSSPPQQRRLLYQLNNDRELRLQKIRFGEIDALEADERDLLWAERNPGYLRQIRCQPKFQNFIAWNLDRRFLQKPKVRRALAQFIDLSQVLFDTPTKYQRPVESLFYPGAPYCKEPMFLPDYSQETASRFLTESGFRLSADDGQYRNESGDPLLIRLTVNKDNAEQLALAQAVTSQWIEAGVSVELEPLSWVEILTERLATREFDAVLLGWELPYERDRFATWHSSQISPAGGNFCGLQNDVVDGLLLALRNEENAEKAEVAAGELQKEIARLQPYFFLCDTGRIITVRQDAIETLRERLDGVQKREKVNVGKSGFERVRPWWILKGNQNSAPSITP